VTRVAASALTPQAAVDRLGAMWEELRFAVLLDEAGELAAHTGYGAEVRDRLHALAGDLFRAADAAGHKVGVDPVGRVEVSRPEGGMFGLRGRDRNDDRWTLVAVAAGGALSSLVLYDLRMTVQAIGTPA
jgi:hypothetical protein